MVSEAKSNVVGIAREIVELRPISFVARRVLQITEDDRFSARELGTVISSDQALTAKMLCLANSAWYGYPRAISTVKDAIVLVGFRAVRSATLASCVIAAAGRTKNLDYVTFWRYSVSIGVIAELIAQTEGADDDEAFTAGVLHNIGRLALDQHLPDQFAAAMRYGRQHSVALERAELALLGFTDAALGAALALKWNFPEALAEAVGHHRVGPGRLRGEQPLTQIIVRSRAFARAIGLSDGIEPTAVGDPPIEWTLPPLAKALGRAGGVEGVRERVNAFLSATNVY